MILCDESNVAFARGQLHTIIDATYPAHAGQIVSFYVCSNYCSYGPM